MLGKMKSKPSFAGAQTVLECKTEKCSVSGHLSSFGATTDAEESAVAASHLKYTAHIKRFGNQLKKIEVMQSLNKHNLLKNSQIWFLTFSPLTNWVYDEHNQRIDMA